MITVVNPFLADEIFFDAEHTFNFLKNRLYVGFDWKMSKSILGSTYYYRESAQGNPWTHANVLVTQIKFIF